MKAGSKRGFTLVELAIVLVIIGLIVGGVLIGQDLIRAAGVQGQVNQISQFNVAVNTFRVKYNGIPGDLQLTRAAQFNFLVPSSCTGTQGQRNGDDLIDGGAGQTNVGGGITLAALMGENALFWMDMSQAGYVHVNPPTGANSWNGGSIDSGLCVYSTTATDPGTYIPKAKIGSKNYIDVYEANGANWFLLQHINSFSAGNSTIIGTPNLAVIDAYNIDQKADDGSPTTGYVRAVYINSSQCCTSPAPNAAVDSSTTCYNTTGYAYSSTFRDGQGQNCALSFRFQ